MAKIIEWNKREKLKNKVTNKKRIFFHGVINLFKAVIYQ